ncbi:MAG: 23S rRNA (uracil(1939)-C(5))-methyltransferase RlmD [Clostridia bacterium]|nr:23S rRNA (uracil(1939)-C(5))-methyltransferase RlmD [Clostridia bacterium]
MLKNDEFIMEIVDVTNEGSGVGKVDGMAVFVPLTAVGDIVKVKALKVKKTYAYGKLMEIITPSSERIENDCPHFNRCGGCAFRHINYEAELALKTNKVKEAVKRIGGVELEPQPILFDKCDRYRNKAQYPISENGGVGFYAFHSHRIIECEDCFLQPEIFSKITDAVSGFVRQYSISIYNEEKHKGLLRHLYIRKGEISSEIMVCFVINGDKLPNAEIIIAELQRLCGDALKSVVLNINKQDTNVILGEKCITLYGSDYITDILAGVKVRLSPLSFYQVNTVMANKLYSKAKEYAKPNGKNIIDLYCGAGTIGLSMAKESKSVIGVEIIEAAVRDAQFNAKENGIDNARFICGDAKTAAEQLKNEGIKPDTVIVDPPRKGCDSELIKIIANDFCPESVVYISCDPATFARDIKIFSEEGYYLVEYTPADLFPRTSHVETVGVLVRTDYTMR